MPAWVVAGCDNKDAEDFIMGATPLEQQILN
jgi:hypothetical protein